MPGTSTLNGKATKEITIPKLHVARLNVRIEGTTPLIAHRFTAEKTIHGSESGTTLKRPPRDPEVEMNAARYVLEDGGDGFPAIGIKRAMVSAGQRFAEAKGTELNGSFSIPSVLVRLIANEPTMRTDRVVLSGPSRTTSVAYRPMYDPWAIEFLLQYTMEFVSPDQLINLLNLAGFTVGLGDWRVEKKGSFGQFTVANVRGADE